MGVAIMYSIPVVLRGQANAVCIFMIHLFGDFPSPILIGVFIEYWGDLVAMMTLLGWLVFAVIFWGFGLCAS